MWFKRKRPPEFVGYVDGANARRIAGWVHDRTRPSERLDVEICSAGAVIGVTRADASRADLVEAGIGDGCYGFRFDLPEGVPEETLAARVKHGGFWLVNKASAMGVGAQLMNSAGRGLPLLEPTLSLRMADERDVEIAERLQSEWRARIAESHARALGGGGAMWTTIVADRHQQLLRLLECRDPRALAIYLVGVQKTPAAEGLEQGDRAYRDFRAATPQGRRAAVAPYHDMLASLAQYMGLARAECAEQNYMGETMFLASRALAAEIESALGFEIASPNVFDGLFGLAVDDRVLDGRDIQALYAALRVIEASGLSAPRVCEIGGGFGKVARYALMRDARHYTIVDLPTVSAMQYFFLSRALPQARVAFRHPADAPGETGVDLVFAPLADASAKIAADIVVNCDSFPEMGEAVCRSYFGRIGAWAPLLLSINQEANRKVGESGERQSVVGDLLPDYGFVRRYRFRSWIRRGYIEELWSAPAA
ncbi:putative sugar O-methyltransferase [Methylosinus sp. Sm6]|uniref:putative sugar O-methyltransferase n=1 Tax=Methylosinus sp. Sm6 TaxID=2866948 RepID=UPI001C98F818|nr:putative sugar O-methyltransferase [Methylosinus sp. Sm6]MBY6242210.1 putative sugar O-methyltransferase [Methylosinus sp. Sm6]